VTLRAPLDATELLDLTGRHNRERSSHSRSASAHGCATAAAGRTGYDATLILGAGQQGFSFRSGQVWAVHVG
jgi:alpha-galactosidase